MWVYISRKQAENKDMIIPEDAIDHEYFIGHIAADGNFYCGRSYKNIDDAMRCVNYLNGGTGSNPSMKL